MNKGKERRGGDWLTLYFNNITREHRLQVNFFLITIIRMI